MTPNVTRSLKVGAGLMVAFALLLVVGTSVSDTGAPDAAAETFVRTTAEAVLQRLRANAATIIAKPALADSIAAEIVLPHFDFDLMSNRALGHFTRELTAEQRMRFVNEFKNLLLHTYARSLIDYRESVITFLSTRPVGPTGYRVRTEVTRPIGNKKLGIDYEVRAQPGGGWKVGDVTLNGVSLLISYRAGFARDIPVIGIENVIAQLATKNAELARAEK